MTFKEGQTPWNKGVRGNGNLWKNGHPRGFLNKHHTELSKKKIKESNIGKAPTYGMIGKKHTEEAKHKISLGHKGRKRPDLSARNKIEIRKGKDHPLWRGGK